MTTINLKKSNLVKKTANNLLHVVEEPKSVVEMITIEAPVVVEKSVVAENKKEEIIVEEIIKRTYKHTNKDKCVFTNSYEAGKESCILRNNLQQDIGRCSNVHLTSIVYNLVGLPIKQVKLQDESNRWSLLTPKQFDTKQVTENNLFKVAELFGFRYKEQDRVATFYSRDCNIAELKKVDKKLRREVYLKLIEGADLSHSINSKNNQFEESAYQKSSWLQELNKIYLQVI